MKVFVLKTRLKKFSASLTWMVLVFEWSLINLFSANLYLTSSVEMQGVRNGPIWIHSLDIDSGEVEHIGVVPSSRFHGNPIKLSSTLSNGILFGVSALSPNLEYVRLDKFQVLESVVRRDNDLPIRDIDALSNWFGLMALKSGREVSIMRINPQQLTSHLYVDYLDFQALTSLPNTASNKKDQYFELIKDNLWMVSVDGSFLNQIDFHGIRKSFEIIPPISDGELLDVIPSDPPKLIIGNKDGLVIRGVDSSLEFLKISNSQILDVHFVNFPYACALTAGQSGGQKVIVFDVTEDLPHFQSIHINGGNYGDFRSIHSGVPLSISNDSVHGQISDYLDQVFWISKRIYQSGEAIKLSWDVKPDIIIKKYIWIKDGRVLFTEESESFHQKIDFEIASTSLNDSGHYQLYISGEDFAFGTKSFEIQVIPGLVYIEELRLAKDHEKAFILVRYPFSNIPMKVEKTSNFITWEDVSKFNFENPGRYILEIDIIDENKAQFFRIYQDEGQ